MKKHRASYYNPMAKSCLQVMTLIVLVIVLVIGLLRWCATIPMAASTRPLMAMA